MTVERVRVGDVLSLKRRPADVRFDGTYEEIGLRSFGRGVFHKEPISGAALGSKRVFWIEPGDLLLSNVFAWEGAVAVAGEAEHGKIGSHRFMTYRPTDDRIDTTWASWYFRSEPGLELIRRASPGSAGRNRTLAIDRFAALEIPLPPVDHQRRIAARFEQVADAASQTSVRLEHARLVTTALADSRESRLLGSLNELGIRFVPLSDVAEVNPRPSRLPSEEEVAFVPMAAVRAEFGDVVDAEMRHTGDIGSGYKQFRRGDVIFARITPCMQNGKSAILRDSAFGYGSTEFHVVRPGPLVTADWVHRILRGKEFRKQAATHFTGTAGQQRVPASFLENVLVPVPPLELQPQLVRKLDALRETGRQIASYHDRAEELAKALIPASLNAEFAML